MKKPFTSIGAGLALSTVALGQGTVRFSNSSSDLSSPPDRLVRFGLGTTNPYGTNDAPLVNSGLSSYRAQLYYGASTTSEPELIPVTAAPALFRSSTTTTEPGTWGGGTRTLIGFPAGATLNLQVRVWDNQFGSTYETAHATGNGYDGKSAVFQYTIPNDPVTPQFQMDGFLGFSVTPIPEPAVPALAGFGLATWLILRRRK